MAAYPVLVDGELRQAAGPALHADDGAYLSGLGCYTTARYRAGRLRHGLRVARRLARDAERLGLPAVDVAGAQEALCRLGEACFGQGEGIVRLQASADGDGRLHLVGLARDVGVERATWAAALLRSCHPGATPFAGVKLSGAPHLAHARAQAAQLQVDDVLLLDSEGLLVEGARTTPIVCDAHGQLLTPPAGRGGVAGVAREILGERLAELVEADLDEAALLGAREIVLVNSVRGARPLHTLDGAAVGAGLPAVWAARLEAALADEE